MFQDGFEYLKQTLNRDVFIDDAVKLLYGASFILKLPDFVRSWIINPLSSLVTSERLASKRYGFILGLISVHF